MVPLRSARFIFGATIMLSHFGTIAAYFLLGSKRLAIADVLQGVGTVSAVAAIYLTTFLNYVANNPVKAPDEDTVISVGAFTVQYFIVLMFSAALLGLPVYTFETGMLPYDEVPLYTAGLDTVFAGYLGIIFKRLFPLANTKDG